MFEVRRHRRTPKWGGVPHAMVSTSFPVQYVATIDKIRDRLQRILGYNVSRATVFRFAIYAMDKLVEGKSDTEFIDAYEAAICEARQVPVSSQEETQQTGSQ
jgi:hypothetical protein